jgi:hypothetical protein
MADEPPSGKLLGAPQEPNDPASPADPDEGARVPEAPVEEPDPFDELWDPDMDTRPERIRRTRARMRPEARTRGGGLPRGKRRDMA